MSRVLVIFLLGSVCVATASAHGLHGLNGRHLHDFVHGLARQDVLDAVAEGAPTQHQFHCGVGDARLEDIEDAADRAVQAAAESGEAAQEYHTVDHEEVVRRARALADEVPAAARVARRAAARRLAQEGTPARRAQVPTENQQYPARQDGSFLSLADADELGLAQPMRVVAYWDLVVNPDGGAGIDGSRSPPLQCNTVGEMVENAFTGQLSHQCIEDDILESAKMDIVQQRTEWASQKVGETFRIKPVQDSITINNNVRAYFEIPSEADLTFEDADLVLIMTARPAVNLNGYALCWQRDQLGRCTVGQFNWVPTVIGTDTLADPEAITAQRHTALHEIVHVLGGIKLDPTFIDDNGNPRAISDVWITGSVESQAYPKQTTKIKTPKVLQLAREHFGCADLDGVPIEDQQTGKVAHWEARLLGPELMSYGTGSSETIIGDITLAYLEDTNQYIANYSQGGRLHASDTDTSTRADASAIEVTPGDDFEPRTLSPGMLRWGKNEGCEFVRGSAADWPEEYICKVHKEYDCTPDNRMSAVCTVLQGWNFQSDVFTCGDCPGSNDQGGCTPTCQFPTNDNCQAGNVNCGLPTMYQYFTSDEASAAFKTTQAVDPTTVGGFSSAMDFVPVRIGYWNCQDSQAGNGSSLLANEAGSSGFSLADQLKGAADNMKLFGGQAQCPSCRCFVSSLMDFSSGKVNPNFPRFGLCYRANCYQEDYLQFAIESQVGRATTWYKCPAGGGKIYIAGFAGAFHCPDPTEFCELEEVTGIKYKETDPLWEWIFWSSVVGSPILLMFCCMFKCFRDRVVNPFRTCCGVNHFDQEGNLYMKSGDLHDQPKTSPPETPAKVLMGLNCLVAFISVVMFLMTMSGIATGRISIAAAFLIAGSVTVCGFSFIGFCAGCRDSEGVSCFAVVYLYIVFFSSLFFLFSCGYAVSFPSAMGGIIERQWPKISETVPEGILPETLDEGDGEELLQTYAAHAFVLALLMGSVLIAELWATIKIVTIPVLAASMYTVINWVMLFAGIAFFGIAGYTARFAVGGEISDGVKIVAGLFGTLGVYFMLLAILEIVASHKKTPRWLSFSMCLSVITMLFTMLGAVVMFQATRDVGDTMEKLTDEQIASISEALGFTNGSREAIIESLRNNMRTMGMFGMCVILMMCCLVASNWFFLVHVQRHVARTKKAAAAALDIGAAGGYGVQMGAPVPHAGHGGHRQGRGGRAKRPTRNRDFI